MFNIIKKLKFREWLFFAVSVGFIVLQVWFDLTMPDYMEKLTALAVSGETGGGRIWKDGALMLGCAFGSAISSIVVGYFISQIASTVAFRMRESVFDKVQSFSMREINNFSTSSLITRTTNDIQQVQNTISMGLQIIVKSPITAAWAVGKILQRHWQWSLATGITVIFIVTALITIFTLMFPKFRQVQKLTDNVNSVTRENLRGVRVVRAYNAEPYQEEKFEQANLKLTKMHLFTARTMSVMSPLMTLVMGGLSLAIYWIGAFLIGDLPTAAERGMMFGQMSAFSGYAMQVVSAFMMLTAVFIMLPRAMVSVRRINEVLRTESTITDGTISKLTEESPVGTVEFKHVSFRYSDSAENVIDDLSFKAERGQTIAFIGSTGSGKSTAINLIPRFYDATEGEVLVDGVNVKDYTLEALHDKIGYVPQHAFLFTGTVEENVAYGQRAGLKFTEQGVRDAVRIAQGQEFVESKDDGYKTYVSQGGTNFSGGQKQRISVARAVCRRPEIYIFDDSFSALDYKTDRQLRTALKKETGDATAIIVAQRIGTIRDADLIIVLEDGKVVGEGTHLQLLKSCEVYREIARSQLSEEEINKGVQEYEQRK